MNRLFAETYAKDQEIEARYDAAELKNDQATMEQTRADHFALEADIQAQGKPFELLYSLYAAAMKVGNQYIDISELHEYQDAMEASQENDTEYFGADYRFHKVFFDYCGNRFLKETYKRYNRIRSLLISSAMRASRDRQPSVDQHRQITAAFEAGQFDLARERMREHYQYGVHLLLDRENHA